jgi:D-serine deaminase-like pyridoxal phosphate-dependent protein
MQVDANNPEANFIASTLLEIETITPLLKTLKQNHRINILYGIPLVPSQVPRLAHLASNLGEDSISVMIDHPDQIPFLTKFSEIAGFPACIFVKVDTGYHRAGLPPLSLNKNGLLEKLAEAEEAGHARFLGLYSHSSLSYSATSAEQAMGYLIGEIRGCKLALNTWLGLLPNRELVISVGATPQVASSSNLVRGMASPSPSPQAEELMALLRDPGPEGAKVRIELHAGNYPVLDMQQVSTNARVGGGGLEEEIALSVLAEVCSVYDGEREKPEALLAAGTLALGREPCPSYEGWGVLSSWRRKDDAASRSRLVVERISQEHAIVAWEDGKTNMNIPLEIGQVVKVFPNHSCVTGAFYGWYFVVDSDEDPSASTIVDVWIRGRGESTDPLLATRFQ